MHGRYDASNVRTFGPISTHLGTKPPLSQNGDTTFVYPHAGSDSVEPTQIMDCPKVLLMNRSLRQGEEVAMLNDLYRSWEGISCSADYEPSGVFLRDFFLTILSFFGNTTQGNGRPAVIITYPSTFSGEEKRQLEAAVGKANIEKYACQTCKIKYLKEGEAAVWATLRDYNNTLLEAHQNDESIIVADYGGITDDIALFRFDHRLGGGSTLPGKFITTKAHWTGARATELAFKRKLLEEARVETRRSDEGYAAGIQHELDATGRRWATKELPREPIVGVIKSSAETKANELLKLIQGEEKPPTYIILCGGFSNCEMLYNEVVNSLTESLGGGQSSIPVPTFLRPLSLINPQLTVSRGIVLSKMPNVCDRYLPHDRAVEATQQPGFNH
ncbi:unnamed protein product [Clonostachys rosea]|uniref:Actin-like ATPase domain-containing protein n=1 Tax=Bionectria ochroleuca TaxID=29856 RepID=A0ABY6UF80_BIOOC|nr:unnamed protein product [Clonostachys rosea]